MPMVDFEFKREGNTLKAFDKATGELIDSGEYVEITSHKQKRRFVAFEKYSYKKFELEEKLWVGADFLKRNLMSSVRYFNAPVLGSTRRMLIGGWLTTFCHTDERSRFVSVI